MADAPAGSRPSENLPFRIQGDPTRIYRRDPDTGLWLGHDLTAPAAESGPALLRSTRTFVSYSNVWGGNPTRSGLVERLRRYDLKTILNAVGQLSSAIHGVRGERLLEVQVGLINSVFGGFHHPVPDAFKDLLVDAFEADAATPVSSVVVFHELQLVNLARLAILEVPPGNAAETEDPGDLAEALLIVNDLIGAEGTVNHPSLPPETDEEWRAWERFLFVNGFFHHTPPPASVLARTWNLYLTDRPHLQKFADYHDLPVLMEDVTGLEPMQLWARLFAVYGHWGKGFAGSSGQFPNPLTQDTYFTDNYGFEPEEEEAFWSLVAAPVEELREEFERQDPTESYNPYDVLPLERRPLVRIGRHLFCPSALLMKRRMTTGLHHVLLNRVPDPKLYLDYMGRVFEDYIVGILQGEYGETEGRVVTEEELQTTVPGQPVCDAVVDFGDGLLLVEVKAKRVNLDVRVRGDLEGMNKMFEDVFIDAARQIDSVIKLVRTGKLYDLGLNPGRIKRYVPVSIALDPIPMNSRTYSRLAGRLEEEGYLQGMMTLPLQLLAAEDVEAFETAAEEGRSVLDLLVGRVREGDHQWAGFLNYMSHRDPDLMDGPHPRLSEQFEKLADRAQALFRERQD